MEFGLDLMEFLLFDFCFVLVLVFELVLVVIFCWIVFWCVEEGELVVVILLVVLMIEVFVFMCSDVFGDGVGLLKVGW